MRKQDIDQRLVKQVLKGDKSSFDVLLLKYQHRVAKIVSRYLSEPAEIMDVTQEVFIKAYRSLDKFRGDSAFYTWLYRVAVNTAKNFAINQGRRPPSHDISIEDAEIQDVVNKLREQASPLHVLLTDEIKATVFRTLESLPNELKITLTLRELEGLSYEEISEIMQCPVGTVRSRLFRAREAIDEKLKPLLKDQ